MGTVTVIFAPLYALFVWISSLFGFITGDNLTKVELPYDPEQGLVWEYDNVDDPYLNLQKTKIEDGKQVFYFKANSFSTPFYNGEVMDLVFTDENGNSQKYYAYRYQEGYTTYKTLEILAPGEYIEFNYTPNPQIKEETYDWNVDPDKEIYVLLDKERFASEKTFTIIYEKDSTESDVISVGLSWHKPTAMEDDHYENGFIQIDFSSGKGVITKEYFSVSTF